jgi:hypothetical protein
MRFKSEVQLEALNNATVDTDKFLVSDSSTVKYRTGAEVLSDIGAQAALTNPVTGTGTLNFVSKFTSTGSTLGDSQIFDNGTNVLIGNTSNFTSNKVQIQTTGSSRLLSLYNTTANGGAKVEFFDGTSNGAIGNLGSNLVFYINSRDTERMRITSTGNVGIGTTTPTAIGTNITTLDIKGSSGGGIRSGVLGGSESTFYTIAAGGYLGTISNIPLNFQTNNSVKATILANGNIGIGTTSPATKLEVSGTASFTGSGGRSVVIEGQSAGRIDINGNGGGGYAVGIRFNSSLGGTALSGIWNYGSGTSQQWLALGGTAYNNSAMYILPSGNVGIGTTSPSETLHVNGNLKIADGSTTKLHITDTILNGIIEYNGFMIDNTKTHFGIDVGSSVMIGVKADTHAYFINSSQEVFGLNGSESGLIASNALMQGSPGDPTTITNWIQIKDENGNKFYLPLYQ